MRRAFTIVEVLVVITIMALIAGLVLASGGMLRRHAQRNRTAGILQTVAHALEIGRATRGGVIAPVEHPLAGSDPGATGRTAFVRAGGGPVATAGMALRGARTDQLTTGAERLLLDADRFASLATPALYGLRRDDCGVVGAPLAGVTRFKQVEVPSGTAAVDPDSAITGYLVEPSGGGAAARRTMETALGPTAIADLVRVGAWFAPPDDDAAHLAVSGRVWSPAAAGLPVAKDCPVTAEGGAPVAYRLRGAGIYDAWNREVLYAVQPGGAIRLLSAGPDGCFRWTPGTDGVLTTAATAGSPDGDDRDGTVDNVVTALEARR